MGPHDSVLQNNIKYWLSWHPKLQKINLYLKWLFFSKKVFTKPRKNKVLLYDSGDAGLKKNMEEYVGKWNPEILNVRGELLNIYVLFHVFLRKGILSGKKLQEYFNLYIEYVNPTLIVTFFDTDNKFYYLSNRHKSTKTLFIQNGSRGPERFDYLSKLSKEERAAMRVDYMLVNGEAIGKAYGKYIDGEPVSIGSLKNNHLQRTEKSVPDTIALISTFRSKYGRLKKFSFEEFFVQRYRIVLEFLVEYAGNNKKELQIIRNTNATDEKEFFDELLVGHKCEFVHQSTRREYSAYQACDRAEIVVGLGSTLAFESAARGNKTLFLSLNHYLLGASSGYPRYGYPLEYPDEGPFWSNIPDPKIFQRILDHLFEINEEEWLAELRKYKFTSLMTYNLGNTLLKEILDRELENGKKDTI